MKKITFLILFIFSCILSKSNEIATDYFTGKIYLENGDTLTAKIHLSYYRSNFIRNSYMDNFGHYLDAKNKVRGLNANKINGFEVMMDSVNYIFLSRSTSNKNDKKEFYHLLNDINNTVRLYEFYDKKIMAAGLVVGFLTAPQLADVAYMIEYNNNTLYFPKRKDFRYDKLAFILSDNKEIEKKIEDQIYKYDDIPLIIATYNKWFAEK
jgi:hypothetical protein